jgi:hypothetical protein
MNERPAAVHRLALDLLDARAYAEPDGRLRTMEVARTFLPLKVAEAIEYADGCAEAFDAVGLIYERGPPGTAVGLLVSAWMATILAREREWGPRLLPLKRLDERLLEGPAGTPMCSFDGECINGPDSYVELLDQIAKASRGQFAPDRVLCARVGQVTDRSLDDEDGMYTLSMRSRGRTHLATIEESSDWVQLGPLTAAINAVLIGDGSRHRAWCGGGGNECRVAFLTEQQAELLQSRGWELATFPDRLRRAKQ